MQTDSGSTNFRKLVKTRLMVSFMLFLCCRGLLLLWCRCKFLRRRHTNTTETLAQSAALVWHICGLPNMLAGAAKFCNQ